MDNRSLFLCFRRLALRAAASGLCKTFLWLWGFFCVAVLIFVAAGLSFWANHALGGRLTVTNQVRYLPDASRLTESEHAALQPLAGGRGLDELTYDGQVGAIYKPPVGSGPIFFTPALLSKVRIRLRAALPELERNIACLDSGQNKIQDDPSADGCYNQAVLYEAKIIRSRGLQNLEELRKIRDLALRTLELTSQEHVRSQPVGKEEIQSAAFDPRCSLNLTPSDHRECPLASKAAISLSADPSETRDRTLIFFAISASLFRLGGAVSRNLETLQDKARRRLEFLDSREG